MYSHTISDNSPVVKLEKATKLSMCRICLVENVRMHAVADKSLQELYEKLTDIPFVTEDNRPMLACFICYAKLKQCCQLQRQCLQAEEMFAQMLNEDYEQKFVMNSGQWVFCGGLNIMSTEQINIVDVRLMEGRDVKEEPPSEVSLETQDSIEPKDTLQSYDSGNGVSLMDIKIEVEEPQELELIEKQEPRSSYDSGDNMSLMEIKIEDQKFELMEKRELSASNRSAVAEEHKLDTWNAKIEDTVNDKQEKMTLPESNSTQNVNHKCEICQRTFREKKNLKTHLRIHTGEKPYKCDVCQRCFSGHSAFNRHTLIHTGEKLFKCDQCQRCCRDLVSLNRHARTHTGEKPHKCDICQRCFGVLFALKRHMRTHTGEKPYKCDILCQKGFGVSSALKRHIRVHTGEKPYKCDKCQHCFVDISDLRKHARIHTGVKPYKCDTCRRSFAEKSNLKIHMRLHTGEKPYKCEICQRSFSKNGNLKAHIRLHTSEKTSNV